MQSSQIHINADYAEHSEFGWPLIDSCLTLSLVTGLSVSDLSQNVVANLGWDKVMLPAPVFAGETIYAESEVLETRASKSRPGQGIVKVRTRGYKQDGSVVIQFERTMLVGRGGAARDHAGADTEEALRLATSAGARLMSGPLQHDGLLPGRIADITALEVNPLTCELDVLPESNVIFTVTDGRVVWDPDGRSKSSSGDLT